MIGELPLVLKPALAIHSFEGGDRHDEIIKKGGGYFYEAAVHVIRPSLIDDEVFVGGLHVVSIEDDLAEVDVCD